MRRRADELAVPANCTALELDLSEVDDGNAAVLARELGGVSRGAA